MAMSDIGPHDLIISAGDCEASGDCSCGTSLGRPIKPNVSLDVLGRRWERHVMEDHRGCDCWACQL
jgi:hypothetical protein